MTEVQTETISSVFDTQVTDTKDNWRLCCPFHSERTPSFYIHKIDLIGHCFGCGVAGRLDLLVAKHLGIAPTKARDRLGLKHLPWLDNYVPEPDPIYPNSWIHAWKRISNHPYLTQRAYADEAIEAFECRWDPSTRRIVFPHICPDGRVVGAVGRATDGREPKYHFYWNADKGQEVWTHRGFWLERSREKVIVCEGILDALRWYTAGFHNVVALIGAQATKRQLRTLREYDRVVLALDNDQAGKAGALAMEHALKGSCSIEYAVYPSYAKDAGDLSPAELIEVANNTITPLEMKLYG